MQDFTPLRYASKKPHYGSKDVFVIFGEVFARGYVNGLIDEAKKVGMKVIYSTVGRRDEHEQLRPLTTEELAQKDTPLINVPLECGFDLEKSAAGQSPVDQLKGLKLSEWNKAQLDPAQVEQSRARGRENFRTRVREYLAELQKHIPDGANVLVAHTMAGGVPRAKIVMPVMNRVFKGHGDRFASSEEFWSGPLGQFCAQSFMDVTANSLADLIELSEPLRKKVTAKGGRTSYVAYGYHGTEILFNGAYHWQSYSPYLQGFAKLELERIAARAMTQEIPVCVFNAPEILTNSSSIFLGVEVALYPLLGAYQKAAPKHPVTEKLKSECAALLKPEHSLEEVLKITDAYFGSEIIARWTKYAAWPQHNGAEQMELMRQTSDKILEMHRDERQLLTATLSEVVFRACGKAMLREAYQPEKPVLWIGHDYVVASSLEPA